MSLTVLAVIENDELVPAEFRDERDHDIIQTHRRAGSQCVAFSVGAGIELALGAGCAVSGPLNEQVRNVHGIRERL